MKIGELAQRLNISASRIRFYEKRGLLSPDRRWDNGYRDYSPSDVDFLKMVLTAQNLGFSLREIGEMAGDFREEGHCCKETLGRLKAKRAEIANRISDMQELEKKLDTMIENYELQSRGSVPAIGQAKMLENV